MALRRGALRRLLPTCGPARLLLLCRLSALRAADGRAGLAALLPTLACCRGCVAWTPEALRPAPVVSSCGVRLAVWAGRVVAPTGEGARFASRAASGCRDFCARWSSRACASLVRCWLSVSSRDVSARSLPVLAGALGVLPPLLLGCGTLVLAPRPRLLPLLLIGSPALLPARRPFLPLPLPLRGGRLPILARVLGETLPVVARVLPFPCPVVEVVVEVVLVDVDVVVVVPPAVIVAVVIVVTEGVAEQSADQGAAGEGADGRPGGARPGAVRIAYWRRHR